MKKDGLFTVATRWCCSLWHWCDSSAFRTKDIAQSPTLLSRLSISNVIVRLQERSQDTMSLRELEQQMLKCVARSPTSSAEVCRVLWVCACLKWWVSQLLQDNLPLQFVTMLMSRAWGPWGKSGFVNPTQERNSHLGWSQSRISEQSLCSSQNAVLACPCLRELLCLAGVNVSWAALKLLLKQMHKSSLRAAIPPSVSSWSPRKLQHKQVTLALPLLKVAHFPTKLCTLTAEIPLPELLSYLSIHASLPKDVPSRGEL